jgi:hypothetical protein
LKIPSIFLLDQYSTNTDSKKAVPWFLDHDPREDSRIDEDSKKVIDKVTVEGENTLVKIKPSPGRNEDYQVRINVFAGDAVDFDNFEADDKSIPNQNTMSRNGYMFKPNDWRNVEITEYIKVNEFGDEDRNGGKHAELQVRSGYHSDDVACEGTSYHFNVYEKKGRVKMEKELKHDNAVYPNNGDGEDPSEDYKTKGLLGKGWIGIKAVVHDTPDGVAVEGYLNLDSPKDNDRPTNNWKLVLNKTDTGSNWHTANGKSVCPDSDSPEYSGRLIKWGGPLVIFRSDNIKDLEWKWASVREIIP